MRLEVSTAVRMMMFFWVSVPCRLVTGWQHIKHNVSMLRVEMAMLGSGGIYIGLEEGKAFLQPYIINPSDINNYLIR
jgi:hypothetical protein